MLTWVWCRGRSAVRCKEPMHLSSWNQGRHSSQSEHCSNVLLHPMGVAWLWPHMESYLETGGGGKDLEQPMPLQQCSGWGASFGFGDGLLLFWLS